MSRRRGIVIAIDGVVGSGKSTTARLVAEELGYRHLDTGAMYRAVTLAAMRRGAAPEDTEALASLLASIDIALEPHAQSGRVLLDGEDVSDAIRRPEVTRRVGSYADLPVVRRALVAQQQRMGAQGGVVAEGRDTASVVFPDADLKIRMVAALEERARRRQRELSAKGVSISLEEVAETVRQRDQQDAVRDYGATAARGDVVEVDTTAMTLEEQVRAVADLARRRGA
ncbi:MAG: (d)CMP kinase [Candidatus Latescibacterota bacterium]